MFDPFGSMVASCDPGGSMRRLLLIDNYDSFTYNIFHGLVEAGAFVTVRRCDEWQLADVAASEPDMIVLSPGPGRPEDAQLCLEVVRTYGSRIPMFGICLGMQVLAVACGGTVEGAPEPVHGKISETRHDGQGVFSGLPSPMSVGRYHSLCVSRVPDCLAVTAHTMDGIVMGLRHRTLPMAGVQFHPDSFLTEHGQELLRHVAQGLL
jgi:anthranilate synthase component II